MAHQSGPQIIGDWPEQSREAAQLVVDVYGEPHESTPLVLTWYEIGLGKRLVASKVCHDHEFPIPHIDSVMSYVDYRVPPDKATPLVQFDGASSLSGPLLRWEPAVMTNRRTSLRSI